MRNDVRRDRAPWVRGQRAGPPGTIQDMDCLLLNSMICAVT